MSELERQLEEFLAKKQPPAEVSNIETNPEKPQEEKVQPELIVIKSRRQRKSKNGLTKRAVIWTKGNPIPENFSEQSKGAIMEEMYQQLADKINNPIKESTSEIIAFMLWIWDIVSQKLSLPLEFSVNDMRKALISMTENGTTWSSGKVYGPTLKIIRMSNGLFTYEDSKIHVNSEMKQSIAFDDFMAMVCSKSKTKKELEPAEKKQKRNKIHTKSDQEIKQSLAKGIVMDVLKFFKETPISGAKVTVMVNDKKDMSKIDILIP